MGTKGVFDWAFFAPCSANDPAVLSRTYDFITATEVIEHVAQPAEVFRTLFSLLTPHGVLGLMTRLVSEDKPFSDWHYQNDPTHICFYSPETFRWIASQWRRDVEVFGADVIVIKPQE